MRSTEAGCPEFPNEPIDGPGCTTDNQDSKYLDPSLSQVPMHLTSDIPSQVPLRPEEHVKAEGDSTPKRKEHDR